MRCFATFDFIRPIFDAIMLSRSRSRLSCPLASTVLALNCELIVQIFVNCWGCARAWRVPCGLGDLARNRLAAYLETEPERLKAQQEEKRAKLEKLERKLGIGADANGNPRGEGPSSGAKRRFDDTEYIEQSRDIVDSVKSAVTAGESPPLLELIRFIHAHPPSAFCRLEFSA